MDSNLAIAPFMDNLNESLSDSFEASPSDYYDQSGRALVDTSTNEDPIEREKNDSKISFRKWGTLGAIGLTLLTTITAIQIGKHSEHSGKLEDLVASVENRKSTLKNSALSLISRVIATTNIEDTNVNDLEDINAILEDLNANEFAELTSATYKRQTTDSAMQSQQTERQRGGEREREEMQVHFVYSYFQNRINKQLGIKELTDILTEDETVVSQGFTVPKGQEVIMNLRFESELAGDSNLNEVVEITIINGYNSSPTIQYVVYSDGNMERGELLIHQIGDVNSTSVALWMPTATPTTPEQ